MPLLTYASCHPATLARDLRDLGAEYAVVRLALLDLFPQTGHLEMVVDLEPLPESQRAPQATTGNARR